jgi:hypothetical protein
MQLLHNVGRAYMPTIQRFGAVIVRMYADDHAPPHFHIEAPDFEVLVRISDLTVIAGEARPPDRQGDPLGRKGAAGVGAQVG